MKRYVSIIFFLICCFLRANAFIEEAVKQLELEYADSEDDEVSIARVSQINQGCCSCFPKGKQGPQQKLSRRRRG